MTENVRIQSVGTYRRQRDAAKDVTNPLPSIQVPDGWEWNTPMYDEDGRERSLRSVDWTYHIDLRAVEPIDDVEGPFMATLKERVGSSESFQTHQVQRLVGIERGAVQDAVYVLVGEALSADVGGSDDLE